MSKKTIYWIATIWLALGMVSTGVVQILKIKQEVDTFTGLGYPVYLMPLIGVLKIVGVVVLLMPKFWELKEWVYAGFFFLMAGAVFSHIAAGHEASVLFGPGLLLTLTMVSWYFRAARYQARIAKSKIISHESPG